MRIAFGRLSSRLTELLINISLTAPSRIKPTRGGVTGAIRVVLWAVRGDNASWPTAGGRRLARPYDPSIAAIPHEVVTVAGPNG